VSAHDFSFAVELSDDPHFDGMLAELSRAVCTHAGLPPDAVQELAGALHESLAGSGARGHRCDVRFRVEAGALHVLVAFDGGGEWRMSRVLPAQS